MTCPKCQSMVQLTPPQADPRGPAAIAMGNKWVDSGALTEDSISDPELPDLDAPRTLAGADPSEPPPVFTPDPAATPGEAPPADGPASPPPPNWQNQKTAKSRRLILSAMIVLGSIVSASILFGVLSRSRSGDAVRTSATETVTDDLIDSEIDPAPVGPDEREPELESTKDAAASDDSTNNVTPKEPEPGDSTKVDIPPATVSRDNLQKLNDDDDVQPPSDLLTDSPLLPASPLEGMTPLGEPTGGDDSDALPEMGTLTELPKDLQGLLTGITGIDRPQFSETQPAPQTIDEIQLDRAAEAEVDLEVAIDRPDPANMRQSLGLSLALQTADPSGYPLNDLMLFMSQLSGVPIEVDWVSFDIVGVPIETRVKVPRNWPTIEDIFASVCGDIDAVYETKTRTISLSPTDARFDQAVKEYLDLSDLGADSGSAVTTARTLLGQTDGDASVVAVPEELGPAQLAVFVCEAIRRARGAKGKMPDDRFARWAGTYTDQLGAWAKLEGGVSGMRRLQPATFASVVRKISKMNAATCYVHWQDAAKQDVQPTDKKMPRTGEGISAAEALDEILQPESMSVRVVDAGHWWIGSEDSFDRFPVIVWFQDGRDANITMKRVDAVIQGAAVNEHVIGAVAVDPASKKCIAILPRYLLRQLPRMLDEKP